MAEQCAQPRLMRKVNGRRRLSDVHRPRPMQVVHDQCRLADTTCYWPMSLARSAQATSYASRPWLMLPIVGQRQCHPGNAHMCVQSLADPVCRWPTSLTRCAHAMLDMCRPWLMLPVDGRRRLADARRPQPMRTHHG
uniref:Uncharacterized protein n=1 Tax=Solanum tuberosum TaxID=4113 RepID=M1E159_SOLTU